MSVASKNLYDLLGNDQEDPESPAPVKTVTKTSTKTGKANADGTGPANSAARGGFGKEQHDFRDRRVGNAANRGRPTDEVPCGGARGGRGARGRGGRGATHHRNADDRHTKNIVPGSEKQAAQSWGATEGAAELNDEQAGEAIAQSEQKDAEAEDAEAEAEAQEPETEKMTLDAWKAKDAEERAALNAGTATSPREANAGVSDKLKAKWASGEVKNELEDYAPQSKVKSKKENRQKQKKDILEWGPLQASQGGQSGSRGRGGDRGDRRGGAPRGAPRGGAPRGGDGFPRGGPRAGRGGAATFKLDEEAFPGLGSK